MFSFALLLFFFLVDLIHHLSELFEIAAHWFMHGLVHFLLLFHHPELVVFCFLGKLFLPVCQYLFSGDSIHDSKIVTFVVQTNWWLKSLIKLSCIIFPRLPGVPEILFHVLRPLVTHRSAYLRSILFFGKYLLKEVVINRLETLRLHSVDIYFLRQYMQRIWMISLRSYVWLKYTILIFNLRWKHSLFIFSLEHEIFCFNPCLFQILFCVTLCFDKSILVFFYLILMLNFIIWIIFNGPLFQFQIKFILVLFEIESLFLANLIDLYQFFSLVNFLFPFIFTPFFEFLILLLWLKFIHGSSSCVCFFLIHYLSWQLFVDEFLFFLFLYLIFLHFS